VTVSPQQSLKKEVDVICLLFWSVCILGKFDKEGFKLNKNNNKYFPLTLIIEFFIIEMAYQQMQCGYLFFSPP
jgi:hypothetical protein